MAATSLIIGGTGVSGSFVVQGLLNRGHAVTVLTSGRHPPTAEDAPWWFADAGPKKLTGEVDKADAVNATLTEAYGEDWSFEHVFVMYGRLRDLAPLFVGRCERFYSAGGAVTYDVWGTATDSVPNSVGGKLMGPHSEATPMMTADGTIFGEPKSFNPKLNKIIESEATVFRCHPTATHIRYGEIYGPNNILPLMWCIVKRLLDGRERIVVSPFARLPRTNSCFGRNAAEYFLLAVDHPETSQGEAFNGFEDVMPTTNEYIELVAEAMGKEGCLEQVEMPEEIATPFRQMESGASDGLASTANWTNEKAKRLLDYKDVVGKREAIALTAKWMVENQETVAANAAIVLQDPFDYESEDKLLAAWDRRDYHACLAIEWPVEPGWGHFYYGKASNPGDSFGGDLEKKYAGSYDRDQNARVVAPKL